MAKEKLHCCIHAQTECGVGTGSECSHRIPHYHDEFCDGSCEYGGKCIPKTFRHQDQYMLLKQKVTILKTDAAKDIYIIEYEKSGKQIQVTLEILFYLLKEVV